MQYAEFSDDGSRLAVGGDDWNGELLNGSTGAVIARFDRAGAAAQLQISKNGRFLITSSNDNAATVWDLATSKTLADLGGAGTVDLTTMSDDGRLIATINYGDFPNMLFAYHSCSGSL